MHQLAVIYKSSRRFDEATELLQKTVDLRKKILGSNNSDTLLSVAILEDPIKLKRE